MEEEIVKIRLKGIGLNNILSNKFADGLNKSKSNLKPVTLIIISEKKDKKGKIKGIAPISLSHSNPQEVEQGILQVDCPEQNLLNEIKEILKKSR